jgi:hypothetical protein
MKLFFIVETFSRKRDTNGNTYHCARITSTLTGRALILRSLNDVNQAYRIVRKYCQDRGRYDAVFEIHVDNMSKVCFNNVNDHKASVWSHLVSQLDLAELER